MTTDPAQAPASALQRVLAFPRALRALRIQYGGMKGLIAAAWGVVASGGLKGLWFRSNLVLRNAAAAKGEFDPVLGTPDPWGVATGSDLRVQPLISVLMATHDTPKDLLDAAIGSVRRQTYPNWELCVVDDASTAPHVKPLLESHAGAEPRVKVAFRRENRNVAAALNAALEMCGGEFVTVLDPDDLLDPKALYGIARAIAEHPDVDYVYSDEDKVSADGARFHGAFYKPDWSPEYLHSLMYARRLGACRASVAREIGGYRSEFDGAQDLDFALRFLSRTQNVRHIPRVLYHGRERQAPSPEADPLAEARACEALRSYLEASGETFRIGPGPRAGQQEVVFLPRGEPLVSIVIPTANASIGIDGRTEWHLDAVTDSIAAKTTYRNHEIVVVHNGNLRDDQRRRLEARPNVRIVAYEAAAFNLAEKINLGCAHARGEYLVLMNDDIRVITPQWIEPMLGMAQRKGVGAVGAKLLFPDGRIQHAGVVILGGCPGHAFYEWPGNSEGYAMQAVVARNCIAVTGACMMTPKRLYDVVGGFASKYRMNYNDVDYCLKLRELGYRTVYVPQAVLYHYEGVSRDGGRSTEIGELETFLADWGGKYRHDPYYNPNLGQYAPYQFRDSDANMNVNRQGPNDGL